MVEEILVRYDFDIVDDGDFLRQSLQEQVLFDIYNRPMRDVTLRPKLRA